MNSDSTSTILPSFTLRRKCKVLIICLCTLLDFFFSTVLAIHWNDLSWASQSVYEYTFGKSSFDLWIFSFIRLALIFGAAIAVVRNPSDAIPRLRAILKPMCYFQGAVVIVVVVKVLASTEYRLDKEEKLWLWGFAGLTCLCSIALLGGLYVLSKMRVLANFSTEEEIGDILERERLLDDEDGLASGEDTGSRRKDKSTVSFWNILAFSKPDIAYLVLAFFFLLSACSAQIFIPYYTGQVIDGIAITKDRKQFERSILIMSLIALAEAICAGLRGGIFSFVCARFNIRINNTLFGSILKQEIGFFDKTNTGEIVSRITSDTTKISDQIGLNINVFLRSIVKAIGVCIFMFKLSWKLTVITLIGLPLIALVSDIYGEYYRKLSAAVQDSVAKSNEVVAEVVSSMKTVRSFANEDNELKRYKRMNHSVFKLKVKEAICYGGYSWCTEILMLAMEVVILYYGGHLVLKGDLTGGNLVSFILYQLELSFCLEEVGDVYTGFMEALGAAQKVFKLIARKPKILNTGTQKPQNLLGKVEFKDVTFSYPTRPNIPVLNGISLTVDPGQVVAFVGASGGGKSTIINMLQHFYEPQFGEVLIDSIPVKELDHKYLHQILSLVGQEPVLFARSVRGNIAYGMDEATTDLETIENVSKLANAHAFIREMPKGYDTETGEKGLQLSGGQKQRVAIARSLIRKPKILLLDEATSALDAESEHLVQEAIYNNLKGHTVLIIAHRLSTIEKADKIIVIDKGVVMEEGNHEELMSKGGAYSNLVQRQLVGMETIAASQDVDSTPTTVRQRSTFSSDSNNISSLSSSYSSHRSSTESLGKSPSTRRL